MYHHNFKNLEEGGGGGTAIATQKFHCSTAQSLHFYGSTVAISA
jgi:hypothetical protein